MGYELARAAKKKGFNVTVISGPSLEKPPAGVRLLRIETTRQLHSAVRMELRKADVLIMTSAVCDFRPRTFSKDKVRSREAITIKLVKNPDILRSITKNERKNKIIVGFSLETKDLFRNSMRKLNTKKLDLIVANKCGAQNMPFGRGRTTVYLLDRKGRKEKLEKKTKAAIAGAILDTVNQLCYTST